jgi:hypothetical protein
MRYVECIIDDDVNILVDITSYILYSKDLHLISFKGGYVNRLVDIHVYGLYGMCTTQVSKSSYFYYLLCSVSSVTYRFFPQERNTTTLHVK